MRELEALGRGCARCGAGAAREETEGRTPASRAFALLFSAEPRPRSGLAYAAGFAGLIYLFRPAAAELALGWFGVAGAGFLLLWGAAAPLALALGLAAARELDRSPRKAGKAQAVLGYLLGLVGTVYLLIEARALWQALG